MLYPSNSNGKAFFYGYKRRPRLIEGSVLICLFRLVLGWLIVLGAAAKHPFMPFFPMVSLRNDQRSVLIPDVPKGSYTSNAESVIVCNSAEYMKAKVATFNVFLFLFGEIHPYEQRGSNVSRFESVPERNLLGRFGLKSSTAATDLSSFYTDIEGFSRPVVSNEQSKVSITKSEIFVRRLIEHLLKWFAGFVYQNKGPFLSNVSLEILLAVLALS